jgi:solute carrier family 66 (lysosomal lysine-arginine transporter), member 1
VCPRSAILSSDLPNSGLLGLPPQARAQRSEEKGLAANLGLTYNPTGALFTQLAPTAIAIGVYFVFADAVLITQCLYYNAKNARRARREERRRGGAAVADGDEDEEDPLIAPRRRSSSIGLPGSHRRPLRHQESNLDPLTRIITGEDETPDTNPWLHNTLSLLAVWVVGTAGFFLSYRMGVWDSATPDVPVGEAPEAQQVQETIGLILGYISALCYLVARIPQIVMNYRAKSCEGKWGKRGCSARPVANIQAGLALLFFLLSMTGNFTYGASLIAYSQDGSYLLTALPWLLGSLGTIVEDSIIFAQFRMYSTKGAPKLAVNDDAMADESDSGYGAV